MSPPANSDEISQLKNSPELDGKAERSRNLKSRAGDLAGRGRETYASQDERYLGDPRWPNEPKHASDNDYDTDRSNQYDSFMDGESTQKLQQSLKQMLSGAFPQRHQLTRRLHQHFQTQRTKQQDMG